MKMTAASHAIRFAASLDEVFVVLSGIIRAYNSLMLQPNPYFGAELNYYKSFRSAYDRAFETADYTEQTKKIGNAFDVNEAMKETIDFETKNSFLLVTTPQYCAYFTKSLCGFMIEPSKEKTIFQKKQSKKYSKWRKVK